MIILLLFAFISGLVTIFAPCIWPILPIILSSSTTGGHRKPLGITLGIVSSFAFFTLAISYIVSIIPFDANILRYLAVAVITFLGLTLLIPKLSQLLEGYVSRMSGKFATKGSENSGFKSGYITGFALGIVWTPCAGPIVGTIATLAGTQQVNFQIILVTLAYVTGVAIPLFVLLTAGQKLFSKTRGVNKYTGIVQQVFGVVMILTAIAIATNYQVTLQAKLLNYFPSYSNFITKLESNDVVTKQLSTLKGSQKALPKYAAAPEFVGITKWLNTEKPLTMKELKGKVVLVDFWTYTCINCVRTLPYVTAWYDKYEKDGFVVIGVHTPEFDFEKKTTNVENAIKQYNIHYPVAQDNDFGTWQAYSNQYWPAHYLIDANGVIRSSHFGEGNYAETENEIRALLAEAGKKVSTDTMKIQDDTVANDQTPETYLGLARLEHSMNSVTNVGVQKFTLSPSIQQNYFSYGGSWDVQNEFATSVANSNLSLQFNADKVFLVITPGSKNDVIHVTLDGMPITAANAGADVKNGVIKLDNARLYELVNLKGNRGKHELHLEFSPAISVFAFTFG
ncbi:cytochrome c biogenesis protein DipZ [soil metagenome]